MIEVEDGRQRQIKPWNDRVEEAARLIDEGLLSIDECEAYESDDEDDEDFRAEVRETLTDLSEKEDEESDETETGEKIRAEEIDWEAIWDEFGMSNPVSRTKLILAVAVSDQTRLSGGADTEEGAGQIITQARKNGQIFPTRWHPEYSFAIAFSAGDRDE